MKEIIIDIDEDGNCAVDGKGFVGSECQKFISEIQKAIGETKQTIEKPEFRQRNIRTSRNKELTR